MEPFPSFGGAAFSPGSRKIIRFILKGCTNRPFFHICVQESKCEAKEPVIEQIGNYDPLPNNHNEKLVAINFQRLEYWLREGAEPTPPVKKLLGLSGYFPVHPTSMEDAFRRRLQLINEIKRLKIEAAKFIPQEETEAVAQEDSKNQPSDSKKEPTDAGNEEPVQDTDSKSNCQAEAWVVVEENQLVRIS